MAQDEILMKRPRNKLYSRRFLPLNISGPRLSVRYLQHKLHRLAKRSLMRIEPLNG